MVIWQFVVPFGLIRNEFHLQFDLTNRLNTSNLMLEIIEVTHMGGFTSFVTKRYLCVGGIEKTRLLVSRNY